MRTFLRRQLIKLAKVFARLTIRKFKPTIVGVTGTVGKTSAKEAIYKVLSSTRRIRRNLANLNNELGLPLTILGNYQDSGGTLFWLGVFCAASIRLLLPKFVFWLTRTEYPEILVLEYAADRPGDLKYLLTIARPNVSVVTAVGDVPVHVEFYDSVESVVREKSRLIEALPANGTAILNADDALVLAMKDKTRSRIITYGFSPSAQVKISNVETRIEADKESGLLKSIGISFKLEHNGTIVPIRLSNTAGATQAYAAAAAACVGLSFNMNPVQIANALSLYKPPSQRLNFLRGLNNTILVDDSYNSSPLSMRAAIETVKELPATRKMAVLGDMRELGKYTEEAHREVGRQAAAVFDIVIAVGSASKALEADYWFENVDQALPKIKELIREGDLILIKASKAIELPKLVSALRE